MSPGRTVRRTQYSKVHVGALQHAVSFFRFGLHRLRPGCVERFEM